MTSALKITFSAALASSACGLTDGSDIHGPAECEGCRIQLSRVAALTTEDPAGQALFPATLLRSTTGAFFLGPTLVPGTVAVYDRGGVFTRSIGRYGEGPGEMREVTSVNPWFGDSVVVVHDRNQFLIYGPDVAAPRTGRFESASFIVRYVTPVAGNSMVAVRFGTGGGEDHPVREFSLTGEPGQGYGESMFFGQGHDYAAIAVSTDTIWAAKRNSYAIDIFSRATGHETGTVTRDLDWFPRNPERNAWGGAPEIIDIARASSGLMWVLISRPRSEFTLAERPRVSSGPVPASPVRVGVGDVQERFEHVLELLDLDRGVLVATATLDRRVSERFMDGDHLYGYEEDPNTGSLTVVLWQLSLASGSQ